MQHLVLAWRALVGPPGPFWAGPSLAFLGPCGPGHWGLPWALAGLSLAGHLVGFWARHLWAPVGPYGLGPCGPPTYPYIYIHIGKTHERSNDPL